MMARAYPALILAAAMSCTGTTGFDLVQFYAAGSGFSDAVKGQPYTFETGAGVRVTLTQASLHVGALYLTQSVPQAGGGPQPCTLPQTYAGAFVGEVRGEGDIDLLDPSVQQIPVIGDGSTIPAANGQVWLTHDASILDGNLNGPDPVPILTLQGSFERATGTQTFSAGITIDLTRISGTPNSALPGEIQICQQRIVSGIAATFTVAQGGTLVLQVDPQALFEGVPFTDLPVATTLAGDAASACLASVSTDTCFTNDDSNTSSTILFSNLKTNGPYRFAWLAPTP
jgi:hypothetical protein